jgi:hypothetical protein
MQNHLQQPERTVTLHSGRRPTQNTQKHKTEQQMSKTFPVHQKQITRPSRRLDVWLIYWSSENLNTVFARDSNHEESYPLTAPDLIKGDSITLSQPLLSNKQAPPSAEKGIFTTCTKTHWPRPHLNVIESDHHFPSICWGPESGCMWPRYI